MTEKRTRRALLTGLGGAGVGATAGCLRLSGSGPGTETATGQSTGTESGGETGSGGETESDDGTGSDDGTDEQLEVVGQVDTLAWEQWIPSDPVISGTAETLALDVQTARAEFPQAAYESFGVSEIAEPLGIDQSDIDYFAGTEQADDSGSAFLTGTFDPDAIRSNLGVSESEVGSYRGYSVSDGFAWGPDAIVTSNYEAVLDTLSGATESLGEAGSDWETLISVVNSGAVSTVQSGSIIESLPATVPRSGLTVDAASDGGAIITVHLMFDSERKAMDVLENNEDAIRSGAAEDEETLESLEQQGKRLVITFSSDTFEF